MNDFFGLSPAAPDQAVPVGKRGPKPELDWVELVAWPAHLIGEHYR